MELCLERDIPKLALLLNRMGKYFTQFQIDNPFQNLYYYLISRYRRVNFGARVDGQKLTTGWENINAIVTDVEYDLEKGTTTLQFSTDMLEYTQQDPELLRALLQIKAMQTIVEQRFTLSAQ